MKVHDLAPAARVDPGPPAGRPGHRRQGRQDRRPGHQGPGRPRHHQARVRGRPAAAHPAHPEAEGLQEPVPGGVQRHQPRHPGGVRGRRRSAPRPCARRAGPQARPGQGAGAGRAHPPRRRCRAHALLPVGERRHRGGGRPGRGARLRRSVTAGRRPRATRSPTAESAIAHGDRSKRQVPGSLRPARQEIRLMRSTLTNLANMFRVPDLRNKILFTLFVIVVYRFGANIPVPGHRLQRGPVAGRLGPARAAWSASSTCSRAGR